MGSLNIKTKFCNNGHCHIRHTLKMFCAVSWVKRKPKITGAKFIQKLVFSSTNSALAPDKFIVPHKSLHTFEVGFSQVYSEFKRKLEKIKARMPHRRTDFIPSGSRSLMRT